MFVLKHQDGEIRYSPRTAGYCLDGDRLYLSLVCEAIEPDSFPEEFRFALDGYQLQGVPKAGSIRIATNPNDQLPNVYVYTTFHANDVEAELEIKSISNEALQIRINVVSDDTNYYDHRARRSPFCGSCSFKLTTKAEMWIPS